MPPCYLTVSGQIVTSYSNYFHLYDSPLLTSTHKLKPVLARAPSSILDTSLHIANFSEVADSTTTSVSSGSTNFNYASVTTAEAHHYRILSTAVTNPNTSRAKPSTTNASSFITRASSPAFTTSHIKLPSYQTIRAPTTSKSTTAIVANAIDKPTSKKVVTIYLTVTDIANTTKSSMTSLRNFTLGIPATGASTENDDFKMTMLLIGWSES